MSYKPAGRHRRSVPPSRVRTAFAVLAVAAAAALSLIGVSGASAAPVSSLPAYPATTTLNLGSPNCVTDSVIMNDVTTGPITDTYGSDGSPVVNSHATPPVTYSMWHLTGSSVWSFAPPPGVQLNTLTGVIASYDGLTDPGPGTWINGGLPADNSTVTYTVRVHGEDALKAKGTEQFQLSVNDDGTDTLPPNTSNVDVSVSYGGNDFDNANGALTIQLNGGSTTSTALTLAPIASSLGIPGSTPVTFALVGSPGWHLSSSDVLTGHSASDPEFSATTANFDRVFFTLSGISTDAGGVFFTNTDSNPCVTPDVVTVATPGAQSSVVGQAISPLNLSASSNLGNPITAWSASNLPAGLTISSNGVVSGTPTASQTNTVTVTATDSGGTSGSASFSWTTSTATLPPPPPPLSTYGNYVNPFGNGFNAFQQHAGYNSRVAGWPATQHDPASHFLRLNEGPNFRLEYAPNGVGTGWCVSNPGDNLLRFRLCNGNIWQQFYTSGGYIHSAVNNGFVNPTGTGGQLVVGGAPSPWGGSKYTWRDFSSLPA